MDMGDNYYTIGTPKKSESKPGWAERARLSHGKFGEFFRKHGDQLKLGGSTALLMGGGAMLMASTAASTPTGQGLAIGAGAASVAAGVLKVGRLAGAQEVAEKHLNGAQNVFDVPFKNSGITAANSDKRGASAITDDPVLQDPAFQKAMASAFTQLQEDPKARSDFHEMIQNSPTARRALLNAQKQMDAANELRNSAGAEAPAHQSPDNRDDEGESMTIH